MLSTLGSTKINNTERGSGDRTEQPGAKVMDHEKLFECIRIARENGDPKVAAIDAKWKEFDLTNICTPIKGKWSFDGIIQFAMYWNELFRAVDPDAGPLPYYAYDPIQWARFFRLRTNCPMWDGKEELWYNGQIVKRFKKTAPNQKGLLSEFEGQGWPQEIHNPWRDQHSVDAANETLRNAVEGLNDDQVDARVIFTTRNQYDYVAWKHSDEAPCNKRSN